MIRMNDSKTTLKAAVLLSVFLLFASAMGFGQQQINLMAGSTTTTLPDGTTLPMWGYTCGVAVTGSTATCAPLSGSTSGAATGALGGIYVVSGGSGYTSAPTVTITPAAGNTPATAAAATAIVEGGQVVGFNLTNPGAGYTAAPTIVLGGPGTGAAAAAGPAWSPVVITVPTGATGGLQINLTNNLSFPTTTVGMNSIPTSIVIVGQVGGGLGGAPTTTPSPLHTLAQGCPEWFIAANPPGTPCTALNATASGQPPLQGPRVQSMATEVAAVAPGTVVTPTSLTWANLKPGTYLLESGTHPSIQVPMGLIGVLVVTTAPSGLTAGTAYPAVAAVTATAPATSVAAAPAVTYNAEVPLEFSEIDPVQNKQVDLAVRTAGFSETTVWSSMNAGGFVGCAVTHTCYPPAVNYTPFYYLIDGVAFSKTAPAFSVFPALAGVSGTPPAPVAIGIPATGTVLVRLVNASPRMHVPSIVGSLTQGFSGAGTVATVGGFTLIAEDGNPVPGVQAPGAAAAPAAPRVQTDVFMAAGKTYDVMINVPAAGATATPALPIYDRSLSLSANSSVRDAGMVAYISVNNALNALANALPLGAGSGIFGAAQAVADTYDAGVACPALATSCVPVVVSDPSKGVIANDVNVYGVALSTPPTHGTLTCAALPSNPVAGICANGTFTYTPNAGTAGTDSFGYCANGTTLGSATAVCTTVTLGASTLAGAPTAVAQNYTAKTATYIKIPSPGLLLGNADCQTVSACNNLPLSLVVPSTPPTVTLAGGATGTPTLVLDAKGGFALAIPGNASAGTATFSYMVQNSQGRTSAAGMVTVNFPAPSNLTVNVLDAQAYNNCNGDTTCISGLTKIGDYRWIIEEDKTFYIDPNCTTNSSITTPGCPSPVAAGGTIPTFGVNFHTSAMDFIAQGCTGPLSCEGGQTMLDTRPACTGTNAAVCSPTAGTHIPAVCDLGNGACRPDPNCATLPCLTSGGTTPSLPGSVHLDPSKRYYISVLPGDAANPFPSNASPPNCSAGPITGSGATATLNTACGHTMSGAPIAAVCNILGGPNACTTTTAYSQPVNVLVLPTPLPTGKLSVIVFEDDYPLNGEQDGGGGSGTVAPIEPGLGGFNIVLWDTYGGLGDVTGQDTYDMFNQPLSNSLAGTIDPSTGVDACPISATPLQATGRGGLITGNGAGPAQASGMTGMIVTCPKYEGDGVTLSPLAGQAVIANLMPEKFSVQAYPGADRIARGEEWLQTNTLDGQHPHDSFIRIGEPSYFQEYGPAGYHVAIGFANPAIINSRYADVCAGVYGAVGACTGTVQGQVDVQRLSRTPDQRLYPSGSRDAFAWTQCWVSLGDPDAEDFMFTKCDANGNFQFTNVPAGSWRLTIGDQWNDQIIDGLSTPANVAATGITNLGNIGVQQWQSNLYTTTFIDDNKNGIKDPGEIGIPFIYTKIRYRDGHNANSLTTDFNGVANFNETFPLFNWYVVEADSGRYKTTGTHTVYDAGGPADGSASCGNGTTARQCGTSTAYAYMANTFEAVPLPADLSVPGAVYCAKADCAGEAAGFAAGTAKPSSPTASTGRIDPPWVRAEGWSGLTGQSNWIEFGKAPFAACPPACVTVGNSVSNQGVAQPITAATEGATVTITTSGTLPAMNDLVTIAGVTPAGYNGTFTVTSIGTGTFSYTDTGTAGLAAASAFGTFTDNTTVAGAQPITAATEGPASAAITSALVPNVGDTVVIAGVSQAGYNGTFTVTNVGTGTFSYAVTTGLTAGSGGTATDTATAGGTTASTTQVGENGGIHGFVDYAATRPFDDASQMIEQPWEPYVPRVTINLYQEGFAKDGTTPTLTLVDTTKTASWDDWAQGFYPNYTDPTTGTPLPYLNCPGQGTATAGTANQDVFFFTLYDQPNYLDWYAGIHTTPVTAPHALPYNSQYKCYDAMHIWNQVQPAVYDGQYSFPSSLGINPATGKLVTTMGCVGNAPGTACPGTSTSTVTVSSLAGTNCTICVKNPDTTDNYRVGTPMLPPGKYVVEVIMPPGYEVYKEEDKNLLIGDNYIAPVTQQFGGLGADIFIIPDQASVASMYDPSAAGYNPSNYQNQTTALGLNEELSGVPGFPGFQDPIWPCVGEMRVVPDYLSLFPQAKETGPFAGATRPLCDRKEVTLPNQMSVSVKFFIFTSTHIASKFTGVITDDYTSEFDPFAPQFGEKFAPPNMPISTRDYLGNELSRVYSDHWGVYNGLTFSSWEVNPPNITGYSPTIMVQCMNDPGPYRDTNPSSPTFGQMINDPLYNPAYSDFCYEQPFMPGLTNYEDSPVVPTQAFVGAAYNDANCSYPDTTPAIKEVDGDGVGPYVSAAGNTLTITALGDQQVSNSAYSGPSANVPPFNMKTITRHYGFGSRCLSPTAGNTTCNTLSTVTIGGVAAVVNNWSDTQIQVTVPTGVPACVIQQQKQYGGSPAQCGELVITAGNGRQSVDTVTVTIGGKAPFHHVAANESIQSWIDQAAPGDLIIVDPTCTTTGLNPTATACSSPGLHAAVPTQAASVAAHTEMLIMWKPVRLQGVGAASSIINANTEPAGKLLDPWRRHINCLFGLTLSGVPYTSGTNSTVSSTNLQPYDPSGAFNCPDAGWLNFTAQPNVPQIDRLPLESTIGWDANLNGNLAEQLQEPSLMGAYEGAGITVLGKGLDFHGLVPWSDGTEGGAFPTGTTLLTGVGPNPLALPVGDSNPLCVDGTSGANRFPSDFMCNPSSIDGLSVVNSSQGGGGIFAHGWAHYLQIANNRVYNNAGTLTGGISVGQGEFPIPYVQGSTTNSAPGSCSDGTGFVTNQHLPYCLQLAVNVHNNFVTNNSSLGDELFSATLAGGGGVTFCTGNDYYKFNYNWVCGNLSSGEGGGLVHLGEIQNGDIERNSIVLNQSQNPTIPTNGGGIQVMGTPDTDPVCGTQSDSDCPPGLSDGIGHNLVINANLIQANMAESGSGGGIRLQQVNGSEVSTFPTQPTLWNNVSLTNNIIVNNVAGWDGAGISLQDSLNVSILNNTIASNDSLASSGVLTYSIGAPMASAPPGECHNTAGTASCPQSAGVTSVPNSSLLTTTFTGLTLTCPFGLGTAPNNCQTFSNPLLQSNVIWQNRSFFVGITGAGTGNQNQQNLVGLFNAGGSAAAAQTAAGQCTAGASYWDVGVRGDTGPGNHSSLYTLSPMYSVLDDTGYDASNQTTNPSIVSQYCNGSRVPPTCTVADGCGGPNGYGVPPGIVDASTPNPVFTFNPNATVDEGNNWINVSWGPLSLSNDAVAGGTTGNYGGGPVFANYALNAGSLAIDYVPITTTTFPTATTPALNTDFFGNPRPDPANTTHFDVGAIEFQGTPGAQGGLISITPDTGMRGTIVAVTITGTGLTGATAVNVSGGGFTTPIPFTVVSSTTITATFTISPGASLTSRNVTVNTPTGTLGPITFSVVAPPAPTLTSISPNSGLRGMPVNVTLTGSGFTPVGTSVNLETPVSGFSFSNVVVVSSTSITATFNTNNGTPLGAVNIYVATAGGSSNTLPYTVTGPVLTGISPISGMRGAANATPVTLTGTGLTGTTAVNVSGGGASVTGVTVVSDTSVTATLTFSDGATGGARNVTTTGPGGTSNAVTFTVIVPPGALSTISPTTGARGTSVPVTLTGTGFTGSTGVNVSSGGGGGGGGITVSGFTVMNDTTITATFTISATATLTARNVTVATAGGTSNPVTFTVVSPGTPTLASISPISGFRGTAVPVTLTGTGFTTTGTAVHVTTPTNGVSIPGGSVHVVNPTTITATLNISGGATIGPREIYVSTPGGTTGTVTFTVGGPVLDSVSPAEAVRGQTIPVSLFGSGLTGTTAINGLGGGGGGGVTHGPITVVNDNQINTTFTISPTATAGVRNVTVTAPGGTSNAVSFNVIALPAPTLTSIAPIMGVRGSGTIAAYPAITVTLTGTSFTGATGVTFSGGGGGGGGITVVPGSLTVLSPEVAQVTINISTTAALTARNVSISTGSGTATLTGAFTVLGPTVASVTPAVGNQGSNGLLVTFSGSYLAGATNLTGLGGGGGVSLVAGSVTSVDPCPPVPPVSTCGTTVTAQLNIAPTAALVAHNVGVTTPIGNTTNTVSFTVQAPPAPTLASLSLASATRPAAGTTPVTVTLTGTNFTAAGTTVNGFTGLGTLTTTVVNSTTITVSFNLASTATAGARNITVTTPGGTTTPALVFTVN